MAENTRLSDFALKDENSSGTTIDGEDNHQDQDGSQSITERTTVQDTTVEPVISPVYGWGDYTCPECGEDVETVWKQGDTLVCPACKEW